MIKVKNISKSFNKKNILNDISFLIDNRECLAIIGESGIGKSVLLKSIIGLLDIDKGSILIDDIDENNLKDTINSLVLNEEKLTKYQNKSWENYSFNQSLIVKNQDRIRSEIVNNFFSHNTKIF